MRKRTSVKTIGQKLSTILYSILALVIIFICYQFANIAQNQIGIWKFFCGILAGVAVSYPLTKNNK
jgi:uncharacterized Tic20 family protein